MNKKIIKSVTLSIITLCLISTLTATAAIKGDGYYKDFYDHGREYVEGRVERPNVGSEAGTKAVASTTCSNYRAVSVALRGYYYFKEDTTIKTLKI
ncbi:MAG TPA: hypothetical protein VFD33_05330 [Bacillota bacterium]|nr:hypothetical protein [Bacillota bacterium]